jgi:hypothetical protein
MRRGNLRVGLAMDDMEVDVASFHANLHIFFLHSIYFISGGVKPLSNGMPC